MNPKDLKSQLETVYKKHNSLLEKEKQRASTELKNLFLSALEWNQTAYEQPKIGDLILTLETKNKDATFNVFVYNNNPNQLLKLWLKLPEINDE